MGPSIQRKAISQWTRTTTIAASRGEIFDSEGKVLATNGKVYKVLVWPKNIAESDRARIASELSRLLGLDYETVLKRCSFTKYQEIVLKRQIDSSTRDAVEALKLGSGVGTAADSKRYYPMGSLFSQVLGFTNVDNVGQAGLELSYNEYLAGVDGKQISETDNSGNQLAFGTTEYIEPINGDKIVITCDSVVESYLEKALAEAVEVNSAKSAQGIIMDCRTGAILGIASSPGYDPNDPPRSDMELLNSLSRNRIVADVYEPGSTFKIITLSAAIDSGVTEGSYYCGGSYKVGSESIHCWRRAGHGSQTLTEAAENSCNCAFMQMALSLGKEKLYDYIYAFGFGASTGSGLIGEASGIVTHEKYVSDNDLARIGFGQSIAVTPIQLCTAVSAAVNGGRLYRPYIIESIIDDSGEAVYRADTAPIRQVISAETSAEVRRILQSVVDNGTGRNAKIEGYAVGGKTGTAQKYDEYGRIDGGRYICSFVGFAPADDPRYVCLILVDEPQVDQIFGSTVAAPFVKSVLEDVLHYKGVAPAEGAKTVEVPDVTGLSAEAARAALEEVGLTAVLQSNDEIVSQLPVPGEKVVEGYQVLLYTHKEDEPEDDEPKQYVKVPDLSGMTPLEAHDALNVLGLELVFEDDDPSGFCYSQSPSEDTVVEVGRKVKAFFRFSPAAD
ncbi:MAG: PASTA domain-containing protein [Clostridia bacterium]|nr:PASTA domain-containing protein [Clostridia bacterium]